MGNNQNININFITFPESQNLPEPEAQTNHVEKQNTPSPVSPLSKIPFNALSPPDKIPVSANDGLPKGTLNGGVVNASCEYR